MKRISALAICAVPAFVLTATTALGQSTNSISAAPPSEKEPGLSGSRVFQAFGSGSEHLRQIRERLEDPQQRMLLRAEQREQIAQSHRDIGEVLELDAATEQQLIELATDLRMDRLDRFHRSAQGRGGSDLWAEFRVEADQETQRIDGLRQLLGPDKLERYQAYEASVHERAQVARLDARLAIPHKFSVGQREHLVALFREHQERELDQRRPAALSRPLLGDSMRELPSLEELQRRSELDTIADNEQIWRRMPESDARLRQQAAAFLTPPQLAVLAQVHQEAADNLQRWIENARVQAGLSAVIPEVPQQEEVVRTPVAGQVKLSIKLTVNRNEPTYFTHVGNSGEPATFAAAEGLVVEATPMLYDDDTFNLEVRYYEQTNAGRRLIGRGGSAGAINATPPGLLSLEHAGSGGSVLKGRKAYAIELSSILEPL